MYFAAFGHTGNPVGYNSINLVNGGFNYLAPDFANLANGGTNFVSDVKPGGNFGYGSKLKFFSQRGGAIKIDLPGNVDQYDAVFTYYRSDDLWTALGDEEIEIYGYTYSEDPSAPRPPTGWYRDDKQGVLYCQNDWAIPFGSGVVVDCQDDNATVSFSGTVDKKDAKINLTNGGFNYTGNCTPKIWGLSDIVPGGGFGYGSKMKFFNPRGGAIKIDLPGNVDQYDAVFTYYDSNDLWTALGDEEIEIYGYEYSEAPDAPRPPTGWYRDDKQGVLYCMNGYKSLNPADGVVIDCQDDNAFVIIPSALQK